MQTVKPGEIFYTRDNYENDGTIFIKGEKVTVMDVEPDFIAFTTGRGLAANHVDFMGKQTFFRLFSRPFEA